MEKNEPRQFVPELNRLAKCKKLKVYPMPPNRFETGKAGGTPRSYSKYNRMEERHLVFAGTESSTGSESGGRCARRV